MFFRNNAMSDEKLSSALYFSAESFAYCCQCSWINVQVVYALLFPSHFFMLIFLFAIM